MTNLQSKPIGGGVGDIAPLGADAPSWPSDLAREAVWGVGPEQVCSAQPRQIFSPKTLPLAFNHKAQQGSLGFCNQQRFGHTARVG
jgi:hypothetical protein